jgi:hypothetical protein
MVTTWLDILCEIRLGDVERVARLAEDLESLVEKYALVQGRSACRWFRGWVLARRGQPLEAFRLIREACEQNMALGMVAGGSETLGYAAEALLLHGDLLIVDQYGERIYLPQLLIIESAIATRRAQTDIAEASLRRAIAEAREQRARWSELLALTELCATPVASSSDRAGLGAMTSTYGNEVTAPVLARARAILSGSP